MNPEEIEKTVKIKIKEESIQLHNLVSGLSTENLEMKSKIAMVELENTEMKKEMRELSLTVKSLIEKLEKLTEG